ncbi:hypothetical protein GGP91_003300 [Salinibacter ruber]|nr:hypothetical protein [Salinibacter ruber]
MADAEAPSITEFHVAGPYLRYLWKQPCASAVGRGAEAPICSWVPFSESVWTAQIWEEEQEETVVEIALGLSQEVFQRLSAGKGLKGERLYDWV